jgi:hypothetical protein
MNDVQRKAVLEILDIQTSLRHAFFKYHSYISHRYLKIDKNLTSLINKLYKEFEEKTK